MLHFSLKSLHTHIPSGCMDFVNGHCKTGFIDKGQRKEICHLKAKLRIGTYAR